MTTLTYQVIHKKVKSINLPEINWKYVITFGSLLCSLMLIFYVFSVNRLTQGAYLVKKYNQEISNLTKENKIMETNFAQADFLEKVHSRAKYLGFQEVSKVKYVEVIDVSIARAR